MVLGTPLRKRSYGRKSISFMGQSFLNEFSNNFRILNTTTSFIHNYKKPVLKNLNMQKMILMTTFIFIIIINIFIIINITSDTVVTINKLSFSK